MLRWASRLRCTECGERDADFVSLMGISNTKDGPPNTGAGHCEWLTSATVFSAMDWLTTITVIVVLVLAFATGRALHRPGRKGDRAT